METNLQQTMTNNQLYATLKGLQSLRAVTGSEGFNRRILKNREILQKHLKEMNKEIIEPSKEHNEYLVKRKELTDPYNAAVNEAKREKKPLPDKDAYVKSIEKLEKEYETEIKKHTENEEKNKKLFEREKTVKLHGIKSEFVPDMQIQQRDVIDPFIID